MSLNSTPVADRIHIGFFGKRNAGKSSLVNAITGQNLAIVSDIKGTTTDPVLKTMELLPLGPVVIIDTPGLDDEGELGKLRIQKSYQMLNKTDIAILVIDSTIGKTKEDEALLIRFAAKNLPYLIVYNKIDLCDTAPEPNEHEIYASSKTQENIFELKERIGKLKPNDISTCPIVADLVDPLDFVILVVPIDSSAPKGRLILPQQQTIRDLLDAGAVSIVIKETELKSALQKINPKPKLIITDSQVFAKVAADAEEQLLLTSFSILFARHKGNLAQAVSGVTALNTLQDGDTILIAEGCTHHRQCDDIGTYKLPKWIREFTKKELTFEFMSGTEFPDDLSLYKLIIHCGGCMLNEREMKYRMQCAADQQIPITNYGITIAFINGILARSIEIFPDIYALLGTDRK